MDLEHIQKQQLGVEVAKKKTDVVKANCEKQSVTNVVVESS